MISWKAFWLSGWLEGILEYVEELAAVYSPLIAIEALQGAKLQLVAALTDDDLDIAAQLIAKIDGAIALYAAMTPKIDLQAELPI